MGQKNQNGDVIYGWFLRMMLVTCFATTHNWHFENKLGSQTYTGVSLTYMHKYLGTYTNSICQLYLAGFFCRNSDKNSSTILLPSIFSKFNFRRILMSSCLLKDVIFLLTTFKKSSFLPNFKIWDCCP